MTGQGGTALATALARGVYFGLNSRPEAAFLSWPKASYDFWG